MSACNSWYVGARSDEVGPSGMLAGTLPGDPILFYRPHDGRGTTLENRCCGRGLPLSRGGVLADDLQRGYRGLTFGPCGVWHPRSGTKPCPPAARVEQYAVMELDHMVWIWLDQEKKMNPP
jgi:phenylpropionate dioxygenase-like ring-hydroxylating dioxygenase large terminal subunit